ncbi:MAG: zf-HC2 domain-containing protein [bacterium]|nr:zf-HC2 domain-containing protein [bacterium]
MTCREAQALITKYVQGQLDLKMLEEFLQHINNCPDCKEELEVYYIVFNGIKRLDEDENIAVNYHTEFETQLMKSELRIKKAKKRHNVKRTIYIILCCFAVLVCSYQLGKLEDKKHVYKESGPSTYEMPYYFEDNKKTDLDQYVYDKFGIDVTNTNNTIIKQNK